MASKLPYMVTPGKLTKILNKIPDASVPTNFNGDFLGTVLGFPGGNQRQFISWAKKCGFLGSDGTPTQLYKNFRNRNLKGVSMAEALRIGYKELYIRNEYCHKLDRTKFIQLVSEATGSPHDNSTVKAIAGTFFNAKPFADFESTNEPQENTEDEVDLSKSRKEDYNGEDSDKKNIKLGLNYTINLVLPKTDDPAVFKAIFTSLKENLLDD